MPFLCECVWSEHPFSHSFDGQHKVASAEELMKYSKAPALAWPGRVVKVSIPQQKLNIIRKVSQLLKSWLYLALISLTSFVGHGDGVGGTASTQQQSAHLIWLFIVSWDKLE